MKPAIKVVAFLSLIVAGIAYQYSYKSEVQQSASDILRDSLDSSSEILEKAKKSQDIPAIQGSGINAANAGKYSYVEVPKICTPIGGGTMCDAPGSGFIVDAERGFIMTNRHLVMRGRNKPASIQVYFYDQVISGELVKTNEAMNLALVRVNPNFLRQHGLRALPLGDRNEILPISTDFTAISSWGQLSISGNINEYVEEDGHTFIGSRAMDLGIKEFIGGPMILHGETMEVIGINTLLGPSRRRPTSRVLTIPIGVALKSLGL